MLCKYFFSEMWDTVENEVVRQLYSKLAIDQNEIPKIFNDLEWLAILESGSGNNVTTPSRWFRIPKKRKSPSVARFQYLIFDDPNDKIDNGQTNRWCELFKTIISNLNFHSNTMNIIQIGFSILARHPTKYKKKQENAYVYVSNL